MWAIAVSGHWPKIIPTLASWGIPNPSKALANLFADFLISKNDQISDLPSFKIFIKAARLLYSILSMVPEAIL